MPTALAMDTIRAATNNAALMKTGKFLMPMPIATASAAETGAEGHAHELLVTHRN